MTRSAEEPALELSGVGRGEQRPQSLQGPCLPTWGGRSTWDVKGMGIAAVRYGREMQTGEEDDVGGADGQVRFG